MDVIKRWAWYLLIYIGVCLGWLAITLSIWWAVGSLLSYPEFLNKAMGRVVLYGFIFAIFFVKIVYNFLRQKFASKKIVIKGGVIMRYIVALADLVILIMMLVSYFQSMTYTPVLLVVFSVFLVILNILFVLRQGSNSLLFVAIRRFKVEQEIKLVEAQKKLSDLKSQH